jgi:hypothetical protein
MKAGGLTRGSPTTCIGLIAALLRAPRLVVLVSVFHMYVATSLGNFNNRGGVGPFVVD